MKVAKLYRLLSKKDGRFNIDGQKEEIRSNALVTEEYIEEVNAGSGASGQYYMIDEEATAKRDMGEIKPKSEMKIDKSDKLDLTK